MCVLRGTIFDQGLTTGEHSDLYDANDIQYCTSNARVPVSGKPQTLDIVLTDSCRHGGPEITHHTRSPQARCDAAVVNDASEQFRFPQAAGCDGFVNDGHHR